MKEPTGIIRLKIDKEDIFMQFNGSLGAFKRFSRSLLYPIINITEGYSFISATYFDEGLTEEELKELTQ
tara:strand:- start:428 stop:634 length:207 start_codon:yes stop_codon:yes gene_type:complete